MIKIKKEIIWYLEKRYNDKSVKIYLINKILTKFLSREKHE